MKENNFQRKGAKSNTQAGKDFENIIDEFLRKNGIELERQKKLAIGINKKKAHAFDLGNDKILVECKSQLWTETLRSPSGKIKNWSDAMFSFYLVQGNYKKLFIVDKSVNGKKNITLLEYFIDKYFYLIPEDVMLVDFNSKNNDYEVYSYDAKEQKHIHKDKEELLNYINK